jgi:uncharacterized protein (TIGR02391 family)
MNSAYMASLVPNPDDLLALSVEEQGRLILKLLTSGATNEAAGPTRSGKVNQHNFFNRGNDFAAPPIYGRSKQEEVDKALMRAWGWLESQGLLVKDPTSGQLWFFLTDEARELASREDATAYSKANLLPKNQVHPLIASKVYAAFLRGEYDTAIFQAFREIEIAVRQASKLPQDLVGDKLMRTAFAPAKGVSAGPLTDTSLPSAEQEAMSHLFAGAFGLYRNSTAHRYVPTDPQEAVEVIMFASQLLRIVDRRKP